MRRTRSRPFELLSLPALSRSTVDRDETLRDDTERIARAWPTARVLVLDSRGNAATVDGGSRLVYRPAAEFGDAPPEGAVLLGEHDGTQYWAVDIPSTSEEQAPSDAGTWRVWERMRSGTQDTENTWLDLRALGGSLSANDAGLLSTAVGLLWWHRHAGFCAHCGAGTVSVRAGWQRDCQNCGRQEYPRTDPAVIVLVHDDADHVLLARQPRWPEGRYSVLAGFVEVGESMEATVVREVAEEVGVHCSGVRYLGSQPWPFPRSLMIGFTAAADRSQPLRLADGEIAEARWVPRSHVRQAIDAGGVHGDLGLPGEPSIARRMIESWAAQP